MVAGGGMCGCWGACMVARGGMCGCLGGVCGCRGVGCVHGHGGHAWLLRGMHGCWGHAWSRGPCMVMGGVCGCQGVCMVTRGMRGCWRCAWLWRGVHRIRRDTVNERAVRILLECILYLIISVLYAITHAVMQLLSFCPFDTTVYESLYWRYVIMWGRNEQAHRLKRDVSFVEHRLGLKPDFYEDFADFDGLVPHNGALPVIGIVCLLI